MGRETILACLLVGGLAFISFINSMNGSFTFDDQFAVERNMDLRPSSPLSNILAHDFWGQNLSSTSSHKSFRPLTTLSFRWNYASAELNTFPYHLTNVLLHTACSIFVFLSAKRIFTASATFGAPLIAGILFATHPVHAEGVSSVVGRAEVLCSFFYLLSFLTYHQMLQIPRAQEIKKVGLFCTSIVFFYLASFSKEIGITVLGILAVFEACNFLSHGLHGRSLKNEGVESLIRLFVVACNGIFYIFLRKFIIGEALSVGHEVFRSLENPIAFMEPGVAKALSIGWIQLYYLFLLVAPVSLSCDYSFNCVPLIHSFDDSRAYLVVAAGFLFSLFLLKLAKQVLIERKYTLTYSLAWMIIPFLPSSHMFIRIGTLIAERLLYIPSIGYCLLLAYLLENVGQFFVSEKQEPSKAVPEKKSKGKEEKVKPKKDEGHLTHRQTLILSIAGAIVAVYIGILYLRNGDWSDDEKLFISALQTCPGSAKVQLNNGIVHRRRNDMHGAIQRFETARRIDPSYCETDYQIGVSYISFDLGKSIDYLRKGLDCKYTQTDAATALIKIAQETGVVSGANPNPVLHFILGEIFERIGEEKHLEMALNHYKIAGNNFLQGSQVETAAKALEAYKKAFELDKGKDKCTYHSLFGQLYSALGKNRDAIYHFKLAQKCGIEIKSFLAPYVRSTHALLQEETGSPDRQFDWAESMDIFGDKTQALSHYSVAAGLFLERNNDLDAKVSIERALAISPTNCGALKQKLSFFKKMDDSDGILKTHMQIAYDSDCPKEDISRSEDQMRVLAAK